MMVTALRISNMNITVMIVKCKYIGVWLHVLMIVGQKNPFLVLHIMEGIIHNVDGAPEINSTTIYRSRIQKSKILDSSFLAFMYASILQKKKERHASILHNH